MKKVPLKKIVVLVTLGMILFMSKGMAQVEKGVTSTGKEVDCSTIDPSIDKTVSEHGKIVTHPRVTRNGKIITEECPTCGIELSITDTVNCVSITLNAAITAGTPTAATLRVYSDAAHTTQVGGDITATIAGTTITAVAANLNCYTRYYFVLEATEGTGTCTFEWTDSTRDMTVDKPTSCLVSNILSNEHESATGVIDSVYDHEGKAYAVVQIGTQCWLKENMRAVTRPNGDTILQMRNSSSDLSLSSPRAYYYENDINNYYKYGCLYNFPAAMDIDDDISKSFPYPHRGICPEGWHVPSDEDWTTLATNAGVGVNTGTGAGKLAGGCNWRVSPNATAPGNYSYSDRNATSFYALPAAGCRGSFYSLTAYANFWSTLVENANNQVYYRDISFEHEYMGRVLHPRNDAYSVRCMRDKAITDTITFDANNGDGVMPQQIVERGIKVALDSNEFTHTGTYDFIGWNTQRNGYGTAYADADSIVTNGNVTLYAQWHTYCSGNIRSNEAGSTRIDSVRDVDNNWYKVIEIGTQCWLTENLRVTHGKNTGAITQANTNTESATQPYYYDYASSDLTLRERGLLYNWSAAVDSTFDALSSESYTNRQGICPDGWHLPSDQEWFVMEKNTLIDDDGIWDTVTLAENSGTLEERDAHITGAGRWVTGDEDAWESDTHETSPGNFFYSERNMIGLNVIPTGDYKPALHPQHGLTDDGIGANFWTSTTSTQGPGYAMGRDVDNFREAVLRHYYEKEFGRSVRCIRDLPLIPEFSLCEDTTFGNITLNNVKNAEKIEFIQGTTVVKTVNNPATEIFVNDLAEGNYKVKATSSTGDTLVDNAYIKHTYTHCTVGNLLTNEMGNGTRLDSVCDHQNNWYEVVQIGNQCWLKENMRTSQTNTGTDLTNKTGTTNKSTTDKYYYVSNKADRYGYVYNYPAANSICPSGWHLPTDDEWKTMVETAGVTDNNTTTGTGLGKLVTSCDWPSLTGDASDPRPGNYEYAERNLSGFSALPAGEWNDDFFADGTAAEFWTATKSSTNAWYRGMGNTDKGTHRYAYQLSRAYSVRCVRDVIIPEMSVCEDTTFGTVALKEVNNVEKIEFIQGTTVMKTIDNPTTEIFVNDLAEGTYKVKVTSSTGDTLVDNARIKHTYTHCTGIAHAGTNLGGGKWANKEWGAGSQIDSVSDHEGNVYEVVQIGNQCWLKQSMRATTKPDGTSILQYPTTGHSTTVPFAYYYNDNNNPSDVKRYGMLYNWAAAMNGATSSTSNPSGVRGICPEGWHLPSTAEYTTLMSQAGVTQVASASGVTGGNAGRLATGCDWSSNSKTTSPGNYSYAERNLSGFSAVPSGNYNGSTTFQFGGERTFLWTATQKDADMAYYRLIAYDIEPTTYTSNTKYSGRSVRCVRDAQTLPTTCSVSSVRSADGSSDLSQEHAFRGSTTEIDSVSDHEGNSYAVVTINGLCVTKQNLRVNSSPTGKVIGTGTGLATEVAKMNVKTVFGAEGYMYNWCAAVDTAGPVTSLVEPRRGLCPKGWHIPSATEIATLESGYDAGNFAAPNDSFVGTNWNTSATANAPGNATDPDKNSSGFSAIPTGYIGNTSDMNLGDGTSFTMWSSAINDISSAQALRIVNDMGSFTHLTPPNKGYGHPVRCVRDNE